jgi:hypothetical protein
MFTITHSRQHVLHGFLGIAILGTAFFSAACDDAASAARADTGRFYGESVVVGDGTARAYVTLDGGAPVEIGVALSEASLQNLPVDGAIHTDHLNMTEWVLPLPADASLTPYRLIVLGWNPQGHEPPFIYDLPHFDFHFYTIEDAERLAIDPKDARAASVPADAEIPQGYVGTHAMMEAPPAAATIPQMGLHWLDPQTPELNGHRFTTTFIYGSWDGRVIFAEPMITREFLESRPDFVQQVAQPRQYGAAGVYPTRYSIKWDEQAREYRIALGGLVKREQ